MGLSWLLLVAQLAKAYRFHRYVHVDKGSSLDEVQASLTAFNQSFGKKGLPLHKIDATQTEAVKLDTQRQRLCTQATDKRFWRAHRAIDGVLQSSEWLVGDWTFHYTFLEMCSRSTCVSLQTVNACVQAHHTLYLVGRMSKGLASFQWLDGVPRSELMAL